MNAADKRNSAKAFKFVDATSSAAGTGFKYYSDPNKYPSEGDCFLQIWELDKWDPESTRRRFDQWYKVEDEDTGRSKDVKNALCAVFRGFVARTVITVNKTKTWKYEFICTDDEGVPAAETDQAFISLRYRKSGEKEARVKNMLIASELESRWELGIYLASSQDDKTWESKSFTYPILFLDSLRNLIRLQLQEGGLTVACYANLNHDEDEKTVDKYKYYAAKVNEQIEEGITAVRDFLHPLRPAAVQNRQKLKLPALKDEKAVWQSVDEELEWQGMQVKSMLKIRDKYKSKDAWLDKYRAWVKAGKAGAKPDPGFPNENKLFTFAQWKTDATAELTRLQTASSSANLLLFFEKAYGVEKAPVAAPASRNKGNICRDLDLAEIETDEPEELKTLIVSKKTIKDVFNDREFPRNSQELAQEFGFLKLDENGAITKGVHPLEDYKDIVPYITSLCQKVEEMYPAFFEDGSKARVYRFVIFTHGSRSSGLKTPAGWFTLKILGEAEGKALIESFAEILAPKVVMTLYSCSTGGNPALNTKKSRESLKNKALASAENELKATYDAEVAKIKAETADKKQQTVLLTKARSDYETAKKKKNQAIEAEWGKLKEYNYNLMNCGGNPDSPSPFRNLLGKGSFAEALCSSLKEAGVSADVWSHTDAGHTSRNSRMRIFTEDGSTHDLVRMIFEDSKEFKTNGEPSKAQLNWWFVRGDSSDMEQQHAVKKAALCAYDSLNDPSVPFSLKNIVEDFRRWYSQP